MNPAETPGGQQLGRKAAAGTPSIGLMQTSAPTFNARCGHTNISDPVDNIIAATRYALAHYGSLDNVPGVVAVRAGLGYVGY
jgi:SLT domain-containing protein